MHCCIISILIDKLEGRVVDQNMVKQKIKTFSVVFKSFAQMISFKVTKNTRDELVNDVVRLLEDSLART